jgi:glycosyltransferase involved in cell wall biosynthesis
MVCPQSPWPATAGSALRSWHWLETASHVAEVGVVALCRSPREAAEAERVLAPRAGWTRLVVAPRTRLRQACDSVAAAVRGTPRLVETAREPALAAAVSAALAGFRPDLVQGEQIGSAPLLDLARRQGLPTLYSAHNVEAHLLAPPAAPSRAARRMARFERRVCAEATGVVGVSDSEARWFAPHARRVTVVPNAVAVDTYPCRMPASRSGHRLAFVGHLGYGPNRAAAGVLAREVLPRVRREWPDARLVLAGREPARDVAQLARMPGVELRGPVDDVRPVLDEARVFVCPLARGAGSRLKLLEAAAAGLPIVSTRLGTEGLRLVADEAFLPAETPAETAAAVLRLIAEPGLAEGLARRARESVRRHHDWRTMSPLLADLYHVSLADHHRS